MNIGINTNRESCMLAVKVHTKTPCRIHVRLRDLYKPKTNYTDRHAMINGTETFYIRMPQSPEKAVLEIFNQRNGNQPEGKDNSFSVVAERDITKHKLTSSLNVRDTKERNLRAFIKFAQQFSERAGIISATVSGQPSIYKSPDGQFEIRYVDVILDHQTGKVITTPARINRATGIIEIAKCYFSKFTVPGRMAILLHEYSHFYLNKNKRSELEADKNALLVYLGLGYPRIEAYQVFLEVFKGAPESVGPLSELRYAQLKTFIATFEKNQKLIIT